MSYTTDLEGFARDIELVLEDNNFEVILGEDLIELGDNIKFKLRTTIEDIDTLIVLLNENSKKSDFINIEINQAIKSNKRIIPLLTSDNKKFLPKSIKSLKFEILEENNDDSIEEFVDKLKNISHGS